MLLQIFYFIESIDNFFWDLAESVVAGSSGGS